MRIANWLMVAGLALAGALLQESGEFTHYVTPDGNPQGLCVSEPCTLTRAASLVGSANMPAGSTVRVAPGVYSQAPLTFRGSGTAERPIRFVGISDVRIVATRLQLPERAWSLAPGTQYTYQAVFDEAQAFTAGFAAQRPPAAWRPILVDDRSGPNSPSFGRPFTLEFPMRFVSRGSVEAVDRQSCTMYHDTGANLVYVHMCHDGPPLEADNLYLGGGNWGNVAIEGDYLHFDNFQIEHAGAGWLVAPSARGTVIHNLKAKGTYIWLQGIETIAEDIEASHVLTPGLPGHSGCYDANPDFGVGECWNQSGSGRGLYVGVERRTTPYNQTIRRAKVSRSWNLAKINGPNTVEDSEFWGTPNHTVEIGDPGVVFRGNVMLNGQDSVFIRDSNIAGLKLEENLAYNSIMVMGTGTVPGPWSFERNVTSIMVHDDQTAASVTDRCNVYIPRYTDAYFLKIIGTGGKPDRVFRSMADAQAAGRETGSHVKPHTAWTDGSLFAHFTGQANPLFDFSLVDPRGLAVCAPNAGPARLRTEPLDPTLYLESEEPEPAPPEKGKGKP